jgi:hypothetical protein
MIKILIRLRLIFVCLFVYRPPKANFPIMSRINFPHKRNFETKELHCNFCERKGHQYEGCLARPTEPLEEERCGYFDRLIHTEKIDVLIYEGLSLAKAHEKFMKLGSILNGPNPMKDRTDNQSLLRSKIGFWKAMGADASVLSWIAYGLPFRTQTEPQSYWFPNHSTKASVEKR